MREREWSAPGETKTACKGHVAEWPKEDHLRRLLYA